MKKLSHGPLYYEFSRHPEPRLRIQPGETILVETEDAFSGQILAPVMIDETRSRCPIATR